MEIATRLAGPACPAYTIRLLRPEDAAGVAACVRPVYGDSYVHPNAEGFEAPSWRGPPPPGTASAAPSPTPNSPKRPATPHEKMHAPRSC
jgi:hypothetical protein